MTKEEALRLWKSASWTELAKAAHEKRIEIHGKKNVSYTVFRIINYTNICKIACSFCSFKNTKPYTLTLKEIHTEALKAKKQGANGIFFQGGVNPDIPLDYYLNVIELLNKKLGFPVRAFSPVELFHMAKDNKMPLPKLLQKLKAAGLSSVPGAGAEIMTARMRKILAPKKLSAKEWCKVMEECHKQGLKSSANIVIGSTESPEDIIEHLNYIREVQNKTGGFQSFIPWVFQPQTSAFPIRHVRSDEYIKLVALCRLFFHNIPNIEVSVLGMGKALGELALYAGGNDISSVVLKERVMRSQGIESIEEAEEFIKNAGFKAVRRGIDYSQLSLIL
ncbi:MAG: CofH family radical SAM protein [Fibromonadaceae bacterium]|jgi:cyclic dehypoxanthinyl futalosine synthase|nr:CofH family radical SAM protein [Fibromonadaceae bacterium]